MILLIISIIILILTFFYYYNSSSNSSNKLVKRPPGYPLFGHIHLLSPGNILDTLQKFQFKYGLYYEMFVFFDRFLIISDYNSIKEITIKRPKIFRRDETIGSPGKSLNLVPSSLFFAEGNTWSRLRRLLSTPFNKNNADLMFYSILIEVKNMIDILNNEIKENNNKIIEVNSEMMKFTLRIIIRVAMGNIALDDYVTSGQFVTDTNTLFDYMITRAFIKDYFWVFISPFSTLEKNAFQANARIEKIVSKVLENNKNGNNNNNNNSQEATSKTFIDIIKNESKSLPNEGEQSKLSDHEVIANVKTMILAGSETTSVVLSWSLYFFTQYPQYYQRLRKEADEKLPSLENIDSSCNNYKNRIELPFAAACFKEALRLRGPAPFLGNSLVNKDAPYTLASGVTILPTDLIFLYLEGLHTDETVFSNALEFNPLRWIESDAKTLEKMNLYTMSFGHGSRICPGMHLAQHEGEIALAYIAKYFDLELACKPEEVKRIQSFTARPESLPMKFFPRKI